MRGPPRRAIIRPKIDMASLRSDFDNSQRWIELAPCKHRWSNLPGRNRFEVDSTRAETAKRPVQGGKRLSPSTCLTTGGNIFPGGRQLARAARIGQEKVLRVRCNSHAETGDPMEDWGSRDRKRSPDLPALDGTEGRMAQWLVQYRVGPKCGRDQGRILLLTEQPLHQPLRLGPERLGRAPCPVALAQRLGVPPAHAGIAGTGDE